jgi:hypothetical protein
MKSASLHEVKKELMLLDPSQLQEMCLAMAKFKKENKDLLAYLLFEAHDKESFIAGVKEYISEEFEIMNRSNTHLIKKSVRKILRTTNKYIKYIGTKEAQIELLIYFCATFKKTRIKLIPNTALGNIYFNRIPQIHKIINSLHEDMRSDYMNELETLA